MKRAERIVYHLARLLLGALFLYAGAVKAMDVEAFAGAVAAYRLLPYAGNLLVAVVLPYIEIVAGILLLVNARVRASALLTGVLTAAFMAAIASALARGLEIDCGCFRPDGRTSPLAALWRDAGILLLAILTFALRGRTLPR